MKIVTLFISLFIVGGILGCSKPQNRETSPDNSTDTTKGETKSKESVADPKLPQGSTEIGTTGKPVKAEKPPAMPSDPQQKTKGTPVKISPDRLCSKDSECTFAPPHPCRCPPCGKKLIESINKKAAKRRKSMYARARFRCRTCNSACSGSWIGRKSLCIKKSCTTVK
jgi:hypothetical protein